MNCLETLSSSITLDTIIFCGLSGLDSANAMAENIIKKDTLSYDPPEINIYYDFCENDLIWSFRYSVKSIKTDYAIIETEEGVKHKIYSNYLPAMRIIDFSMTKHRIFKEDVFIHFEF